jgi:hypothetical protein
MTSSSIHGLGVFPRVLRIIDLPTTNEPIFSNSKSSIKLQFSLKKNLFLCGAVDTQSSPSSSRVCAPRSFGSPSSLINVRASIPSSLQSSSIQRHQLVPIEIVLSQCLRSLPPKMLGKAVPRVTAPFLSRRAVAIPRFSLAPRYVTTDAASSHAEPEHVPEVCFS